VSTEWIVLVWSMKYVVTITKVFTYTNHIGNWTIFSRVATRSRIKIYPKNKPAKNARNNGNLTRRTSELHERAINSKKRPHCHLFLRRIQERL